MKSPGEAVIFERFPRCYFPEQSRGAMRFTAMKRSLIAALLLASPLAACGDGGEVAQNNIAAAPAETANQAAPPANAAAPGNEAAEAPAPLTFIRPTGYDTIRIGAKPQEVGYGLADAGGYDGPCRIWTSPRLPGLAVMVDEGIIRRLTLHASRGTPSPIRTERGIGVGSTEAEVRAAYSPLGQEAHKYEEAPAKYLNWGEEGVPQAFRFEIGANGRVTELHAGESPWLTYVEGCS